MSLKLIVTGTYNKLLHCNSTLKLFKLSIFPTEGINKKRECVAKPFDLLEGIQIYFFFEPLVQLLLLSRCTNIILYWKDNFLSWFSSGRVYTSQLLTEITYWNCSLQKWRLPSNCSLQLPSNIMVLVKQSLQSLLLWVGIPV